MIPRSLPEFHVFDAGTVLQFEVRSGKNSVVDLSQAIAIELLFMRPDGSTFSRNAQLSPAEESGDMDGMDGIAFYVLQACDFDVSGNWFLQLFIEIGGGSWYSSIVSVVVFPNLINLTGALETLAP